MSASERAGPSTRAEVSCLVRRTCSAVGSDGRRELDARRGRADERKEQIEAARGVDGGRRCPAAARCDGPDVGASEQLVEEAVPENAHAEPGVRTSEVGGEKPDEEVVRAEADARARGPAAARKREGVGAGRIEGLVARDDGCAAAERP